MLIKKLVNQEGKGKGKSNLPNVDSNWYYAFEPDSVAFSPDEEFTIRYKNNIVMRIPVYDSYNDSEKFTKMIIAIIRHNEKAMKTIIDMNNNS